MVSIYDDRTSNEVIVKFNNSPSKLAPKLLFEYLQIKEEGKTKDWGNGYKYRLDRRPAHMGGDQLHIYNRHGQAWAYRYTGARSEPNKYSSPATNIVKGIVSDIFKLDIASIEDALIVNASEERLMIEITFA